MEATKDSPAAEEKQKSIVPAQSAPRSIVTRRNSRLAERHGVVESNERERSDRSKPSLVTRRNESLRRRRRKHLLIALAIVLAFFPPIWAVYIIAWLFWRSRPKQKSMRLVRKSVRSLEKNRSGIALRHLQDAHLLDPSNNDALYWMGLLLSRQERHGEAAEALSLVAERVPGVPEVEAALVDAYLATGDADSALYHAQRLLEAAPYDPETALKLADAYAAAGKPERAIEALEHAPLHKRSLTKELAQIHYRLGELYERRGDHAQAREHFERVADWDVTFRDANERMKALAPPE